MIEQLAEKIKAKKGKQCQHDFRDVFFEPSEHSPGEVYVFCKACGHNIHCPVEEAVIIFEKKLREYLDF